LNHLGANFADFALSMLVQSSLLIVLLFALDLVLRNRVRAVVRYGLWMLVLIKLVLPPSFAAPTSLPYWLPEKKAVKTPPAPSQQFVVR
jgi:beta-lactamase regulating signal transducer with metallopeptidase domain